jgi:hypothetical protein
VEGLEGVLAAASVNGECDMVLGITDEIVEDVMVKKTGTEDRDMAVMVMMVEQLGDCLDHPHEQVGRCVYCKEDGRRLYQGKVMNRAEVGGLKELRRLMAEEVKAEGDSEEDSEEDSEKCWEEVDDE